MSITTFTLQSPTTATAPFVVGHAFKQGDVPAGQSVVAAGTVAFQCTVKNAWGDGSLKFAVLAGTAALTGGTPLTITLSAGSPAGGTALTTTDLKATGVTASIDCGTFGTVSWATTDWDSPAQSWISGPIMSSWVYRKPVGSDAHLVGWLEVRLYAGGAVEVLPWIENGYLKVASPTNKSATYGFTLGGSSRYSGTLNLQSHMRTPLINGAALSYWLGTDPGVSPAHNATYLQTTELVPTYSATFAAGSTLVTSQVTTYAPFQAGGFIYDGDTMTSTGYQSPIGLLPEADVVYLAAPSSVRASLYGSVVRNGFSAGRYPIHYRDETTQRALRFSSYPTLCLADGSGFAFNGASSVGDLTPAITGGFLAAWDTAHSPSVGYLAYLLTGRWYFMEECQLVATVNYLGKTDSSVCRNGSQGLTKPDGGWQTRACAWDWRSLIHALTVTPDADTTLRNEFISVVEANINYFHATYIAQTNNPYGWIRPSESYSPPPMQAPWQQDFVTAAFGWSLSLGLPISGTAAGKLSAFFAWKAKSVVRRLGLSADWWWINPAPYIMVISPSATPDYFTGAGPWYATDHDCYTATYASPPPWLGSTEGTIAAEIIPGATGQLGNMTPALAYAVRHGASGAAAARTRLLGATNYASALGDDFNIHPVWSVAPAVIPASGGNVGITLNIDTMDLIPGRLTIGVTGLGTLGSLVRSQTATGDSGPGALYGDWDAGDDNKEFRFHITTPPSAGSLFINENGSLIFSGPDGSYTCVGDLIVDGVTIGSKTISLQIGAPTPPPSPAPPPSRGGVLGVSSSGVVASVQPGRFCILNTGTVLALTARGAVGLSASGSISVLIF